jgi:hypothetical protein
MKNLLITLAAFGLMATAAHAGEPWPEKICNVLHGYERFDIKVSDHQPYKLAIARSNVLHMLRAHCGDDIREREAVDVKAVGGGDGGSVGVGGGGSDGDWQWGRDWGVEIGGGSRRDNPTHCTSFPLGGGMAAIDCD